MIDIKLEKKQGDFTLNTSFVSKGTGITALFGHSGAGKTSIINMLCGLVKPDAGHIIVNGRCLFDAQKNILIPTANRRFGYIFQDARLFPHLSVLKNLTYGMKRVPRRERYISFDPVVDLLGIGHLLERQPANLSGGEKQRVAIGRAVLASPRLLLMDEPLASLDSARKNELLPFIAALSKELSVPVLYVSHCVDEILNLADTVVLLSNGRSLAVGSVEDIVTGSGFQTLTGNMETGVVIPTRVESHDRISGLTQLRFSGGLLKLPLISTAVGEKVRVRIHPRDVGISLEAYPKTSFQNIFPATVEEIIEPGNGQMVKVRMNIKKPLLATITPKARKELNLKTGTPVYAMVKSVSISAGKTIPAKNF